MWKPYGELSRGRPREDISDNVYKACEMGDFAAAPSNATRS